MADVMCNDNRFEVIGKAKEHLLEATNIETSPDEMAVLDSFLFRCWQMGWLKQYDVSPINHARWEEIDDLDFDTLYRCSVCEEEFYLEDGTPQENHYYYCPCCGSKMDGGDEDE